MGNLRRQDNLRRGYANTVSGQIHYATAGEGEVVMVFVGAPRTLRLTAGLCLLLKERYQPVAVDQPGFGGSDPMPDGATMEDVADAMLGVLDALNVERAHLFGFHTGAKVAAALASRNPDRIRSLTIGGKSHSIIPDKDERNEAMLAVVRERYFANGAGPLNGRDPVAAWAALWRQVSGNWWNNRIFESDDPAGVLEKLADKIYDSLAAHDTVYQSYTANFAFDFRAAIAAFPGPVDVIEYTSRVEDDLYGRQGARLAAVAMRGRSHALPDTDPDGLALHADTAALAELLMSILDGHRQTPHK